MDTDNPIHSLPTTQLRYSIHSCSSVSGEYYPQHILVDSPEDSGSRWAGSYLTPTTSTPSARTESPSSVSVPFPSSDLSQLPQQERSNGVIPKGKMEQNSNWIMLKLEKMSMIRTITFGKYQARHPCTVKTFVILAGRSPDHMKEILRGSLKHDATPETFQVNWREAGAGDDGLPIPSLYVKILPLTAQMESYNCSIWYLALGGIDDEAIMKPLIQQHDQAMQTRTTLLVLKHLRQSQLFPAYQALLSSLSSSATEPYPFEHPLLTSLYSVLVAPAFDLPRSEALVERIAEEGLFDEYRRAQGETSHWRRLSGRSGPSKRGGHQMVFDRGSQANEISREGGIWLFGGWDGERNWDDLWLWTRSKGWELAEGDELATQERPEARSCHSMVVDEDAGKLYVMGRYLEEDVGSALSVNDFWSFDMESRRWTLLSKDTSLEGGPSLLYDHQIILDPISHSLFCYGGTTLLANGTASYSGMYRYSIHDKRWTKLFDESERGLVSRTGHSMLWDSRRKEIYIFGGARNSTYFSDFWSFNPSTDSLICLDPNYSSPASSSSSHAGGPQPSFTQRSVLVLSPISPTEDKIVLLSGLIRESSESRPRVRSELWEMRLQNREWSRIAGLGRPSSDGDGDAGKLGSGSRRQDGKQRDESEPIPRFAHQLVYDSSSSSFFCFGGNRGSAEEGNSAIHERMNDFWEMRIEEFPRLEVTRLCLLALRRQTYFELCETSPMTALSFIQNQLNAVVAHEDLDESASYQSLLAHLISKPFEDVDMPGLESRSASPSDHSAPLELIGDNIPREKMHRQRREVWDRVLSFVPERYREPVQELAAVVDSVVEVGC